MPTNLKDVIRSLMPRGAAWAVRSGYDWDKFISGSGLNWGIMDDFMKSLGSIRDPQRTPILSDLEKEFGIIPQDSLTDQERRDNLDALKYQLARPGDLDGLQDLLTDSGFLCTVSKNNPKIDPTLYILDQDLLVNGDIVIDQYKLWTMVANNTSPIPAGCPAFAGHDNAHAGMYSAVQTTLKKFYIPRKSNVFVDWEMEYKGVTEWDAVNAATLTKETDSPPNGMQYLRVKRNGVNNPGATQLTGLSALVIPGREYRLTGWARGDGTYYPYIGRQAVGAGTPYWTGIPSTTWQRINTTITPDTNGELILYSSASAGTGYSDFDEIYISETANIPSDRHNYIFYVHGGVTGYTDINGSDFEEIGNAYWDAEAQTLLEKENPTHTNAWYDDFKSDATVILNRGVATGAPTISDGVTLNGSTQYITYALFGSEFNSSNISIIVEFTPDFYPGENVLRTLFEADDTLGADRYYVKKQNTASSNTLDIMLGNTAIASIALEDYVNFWRYNVNNTLIISSTTGDTDVWLNGHLILDSDNTAWAAANPIELHAGSDLAGSNFYKGVLSAIYVEKSRVNASDAEKLTQRGWHDWQDEKVRSKRQTALQEIEPVQPDADYGASYKMDIDGANNVWSQAWLNHMLDGNCEKTGFADYTATNANLSKSLASPYSGKRNLVVTGTGAIPSASQVITTIGRDYRVVGWAKGDGTRAPEVLDGVVQLWLGTSSTSWQAFDVTYTAAATTVYLAINGGGAADVCEFDQIGVYEISPATDLDMEAVGFAAWGSVNAPITTKDTTDPYSGSKCARIAFGGVANPAITQTAFTVGSEYRLGGWARSDGTQVPRIQDGAVVIWTGTATADIWQRFDIFFTAANTFLYLELFGGGGYVEFDDITISPALDPRIGTSVNASNETTQYGRSIDFDGAGDQITLGGAAHPGFSIEAQTISAWFRPDDVTSIQGIISNGNAAANMQAMYINASGTLVYSASNGAAEQSASTPIISGKWYHAVGTRYYDGVNTYLNLYINGTLEESSNFAGPPNLANTTAIIGQHGAGDDFDGDISEVSAMPGWKDATWVAAEYARGYTALTNGSYAEQLLTSDAAHRPLTGQAYGDGSSGYPMIMTRDAISNEWKVDFFGTNSTSEQSINTITSMGGVDWTIRQSANNWTWRDVAYGEPNGTPLFVAVAASGVGTRVQTSPDGITWTARNSAANHQWQSITYGEPNGTPLFVAVADSSVGERVQTSPDGINWTIRTSAADLIWEDVCYGVVNGSGLFVAVARDGVLGSVMTSPDGINWTLRNSANANQWRGVCHGQGMFVAVASSGAGNRVQTSPDGITWTERANSIDNNFYAVQYGNGRFVAVATSGAATQRAMYSLNGIDWFTGVSVASNNWYDIAFGNGLFVACAVTGTGNRIMTSPDGYNWTARLTPKKDSIAAGWHGITFGNGTFVGVSWNGITDSVLTSTSGIDAIRLYNKVSTDGSVKFDNISTLSPTFTRCEVSSGREDEFKRIILRYKPMDSWAGLMVDFV